MAHYLQEETIMIHYIPKVHDCEGAALVLYSGAGLSKATLDTPKGYVLGRVSWTRSGQAFGFLVMKWHDCDHEESHLEIRGETEMVTAVIGKAWALLASTVLAAR